MSMPFLFVSLFTRINCHTSKARCLLYGLWNKEWWIPFYCVRLNLIQIGILWGKVEMYFWATSIPGLSVSRLTFQFRLLLGRIQQEAIVRLQILGEENDFSGQVRSCTK